MRLHRLRSISGIWLCDLPKSFLLCFLQLWKNFWMLEFSRLYLPYHHDVQPCFSPPNSSFWRIRISAMTIYVLNPSIHAMNYKLSTLIMVNLSTRIYSFLFSLLVTAGALSLITFYVSAAIGIVNDMMRRTSIESPPVCIEAADRTAVRIGIDFLLLRNRLNLICIVNYIRHSTNANLYNVILCVNLVMKTGN